MAVSSDAFVVGSTDSVVQDYSLDFTPGAGSDMVIIAVHAVMRSSPYKSESVTYDPSGTNKAFTLIKEFENTSTTIWFAVWILKDADIVKSTLKEIRGRTAAGGANHGLHIGSFVGVDQTTPNGTASTKLLTGSEQNLSEVLTSVSGDMAVDAVADQASLSSTGLAVGAGQTLFGSLQDTGSRANGASYEAATGTTTTMEWTQTNSYDLAWIGVILNQAAAAAGGNLSSDGTSTHTLTGASTAASDFTSAGATTMTMVGSSESTSAFSASGAAVMTMVGTSSAASEISAAGAGTMTMTGASSQSGVFSADGLATMTMTATSEVTSEISAIGASTMTMVGTSEAVSAFSAAGAAVLTMTGASEVTSALSADGVATMIMVGTTVATTETALDFGGVATMTMTGASEVTAELSAAGAATLTMTGASEAASIFSAVGAGVMTMTGASEAASAFSATGAATVTMVGETVAAGETAFSAVGTATMTMVGASDAEAVMTSTGTGEVTFSSTVPEEEEAIPSVPGFDGGAWGRRSSYLKQKERRQLKREDDEIIAIIQQLAPDIMQHYRRLH